MMKSEEKVRESVSRAYAQAVSKDSVGGCCAPACCGGERAEPTGIGSGNYDPTELQGIPLDAAEHSLGCGNPLAYSGVKEGDTVLDLGSGAGIDILLAGKRVGPTGRVIGVDMTDEMITKANRNIADSGLRNVEIRKGIIENLPVASDSVDWVISNCVVNLSPEKERVFAEIVRVLKPGGRIRISDMVVEDFPEWLRTHEALYASCIAGAISEEEYIAGLQTAGLTEVEVAGRAVYDSSQLRAMAKAEILNPGEASGCCGGFLEAVDFLDGKVWSAVIVGQKPLK